jgi:hypothetical protein
VLELRLEILAAGFILICGPVFVWRRRDNIFAYYQVGFFFITFFIPWLIPTTIGVFDHAVVELYARLFVIGAFTFLLGLAFGAQFGNRSVNKVPITFTRSLPADDPSPLVMRRSRLLTLVAVVSLFAAFWVLGYIPLFAANRLAAKYGIGDYLAGFLRGAGIYHFALAIGSTILPVVVFLVWRRRRRAVDLALGGLLALGLMLSLSRDAALSGPAIFLVAWCIYRRMRAVTVLAVVCVTFSLGVLSNELVFTPSGLQGSLLDRVAANAADIPSQIGFLQGYRLQGSQQIGTKTLLAGLSPGRSDWEPGLYSLRTLIGVRDVSQFPSGGLRLPAPLWGYAAYGYLGAAAWSFISGIFTGWGVTKVRRLLDKSGEHPPQLLNLILAVTFYNGTFGLLAEFYFPQTSGFVLFAVALALGLNIVVRANPGAPGGPVSVRDAPDARENGQQPQPVRSRGG